MRKQLFALLLQGKSIIVFDNVSRSLRGDSLCAILTTETWSDRQLGISSAPEVSTRATFIATGNNISVRGDLAERALVCRLNANDARPEERRFDIDLHSVVPQMRATLVTAALTVVLAFLTEGRPETGARPFGRFERWAMAVRNPLLWLGQADPVATREKVRARDTVRELLHPLLLQWFYHQDNAAPQARSVRWFLQCATFGTPAYLAAEAIAGGNGERIDAKRLGEFIARHADRWEDLGPVKDCGLLTLRFVRAGLDRSKTATWLVEHSKAAAA